MNISNIDFVDRYVCLNVIDSTNSYAKQLSDIPCDKITVIRALRQTGGRGRGANAFFSDHEGGLWASIVVPVGDIATHFRHNRAASLAILESLKGICSGGGGVSADSGGVSAGTNGGSVSADLKIKWPNDIFWGGRKISGILLENIPGRPGMMVIGFGVNVNISAGGFPEELRGAATSALIETGREHSIEPLLCGILKKYRQYANNSDDGAVHKLYSNYLYKKGRAATVNDRPGTFITVDPDGRLRLATDVGHELFSTGALRFNKDGNNGE